MRPPGETSRAGYPTDGYRLLDSGEGLRLEQWGAYRLARPDPTARWPRSRPASEWSDADAAYAGRAGAGRWEVLTGVPSSWPVKVGGVRLLARLAPYKHTGIFPEQASQWDWMRRVAPARRLSVLNLFAYTGGATVALALAGHGVTHVDASKPALAWARENAALNELPARAVRWIRDDASAFVRREARRAKRYDALLLDPPAAGHGPGGGRWEALRDLPDLLSRAAGLLSAPAFVVVNTYTGRLPPPVLRGIVEDALGTRGRLESGTLALVQADGRRLPTGSYARWSPGVRA
jgi:23S rRNA (cytosine1962-C5)-methyltransferase